MSKKYLLGGVAPLLLGAYIFSVLGASLHSTGDMGNMVMDDSSAMSASSTGGDTREDFQTAINIMMEGIMRPATGYPDVDFVKSMIPHHEGAVTMAEIEKQFGKDQFLQNIATNLVQSEGAEVAVLKAWLSRQDLSSIKIIPEAIKANYAFMISMMDGMSVSFTGNTDVDFARTMIPHHQGEIDMARVVLQFGKDAEIRKLARDTLSAQEAELTSLKEWLAKATN
jgi:uncharacterized protein (DUF305 family)